jgi:hypothetical protein
LITPDALASELVLRLSPFLPSPVELHAVRDEVLVMNAVGIWCRIDVGMLLPWDGPDDVAYTCDRVLDQVQDFVTEELADPWPGPEGQKKIPLPYAEVMGTEIYLGFGQGDPVLELRPISWQ